MYWHDNRHSYSTEQPDTSWLGLRFHLLGSPSVTWNNRTLEIQRRSVRALLYRLACATGPVTRSHLLCLFWTEVPETVARRNLSHHLTHLRRALPDRQVLVAMGEQVWLAPDLFWCDAAILKNVLPDTSASITRLQYLASLYHGCFLEGFDLPGCPEFEHWCEAERHTLECGFLQALERLVETCDSCGEDGLAAEYARRYLQIDPLSEAMHRRLIQLYAAAGDRHLAFQQYKWCATVLERELGVDPLPETRAAYESVRQGKALFPKPTPILFPSPASGIEVPFISREQELEQLEAVFTHRSTRPGQVVFISGEAGIGKSRLMWEFVQRHARIGRHAREVSILYGRGHAGEQMIPYQPITNILRVMLDRAGPETGSREVGVTSKRSPPDYIDPAWLSEITRLLPEVSLVYPEIPLPLTVEPESARTRLFDAICQLLLAYAVARGPVLLCLDDLQWVDPSTKAWLVHVGHRLAWASYPILIVGTYRSEEAETILDLRHNLAREGMLIELKLAGLEEAAVLKLLRQIASCQTLEEAVAARLHQATGGNPFYLIEIVHKLIEEDRLSASLPEPDLRQLPKSVCQAIQERLQHLSPVARQLLDAGAVLGSSFTIELLRLTAGRAHGETLTGLEELVARHLLVEARDEYGFIHEIIRQHVYENLGMARRQLLHRRAGRVYQRFRPNMYPMMALHFEMGDVLPKALHYHRLASGQAQKLFAWRTAEFHHGRMLALIALLDPDNREPALVRQQAAALADRARARYLLDETVERDADLSALSILGETCADDQVRLQAILNRLRYLITDGKYTQAITTAKNGMTLIASCPDLFEDEDEASLARSRLLAHLAYALYFLGQPVESLGVLDEAWALCQERNDPEACGRIQRIMGYVYLHLGDCARALACQQQAYLYHTQAEDTIRLAWNLVDIGVINKKMGVETRAQRLIEEGLEMAVQVGSQQAQAYGLVHLGGLALYQGDYAAALTHIRKVLSLRQAIPDEHIITTAETGIGLTLYHLGDYIACRHWLERARQRARNVGHCYRIAETSIQLGLLDIVERRLALARQHLDEGLALARESQAGECLAAGLATMARLERLAFNPSVALESAVEAVLVAQRINGTEYVTWGEIEVGLAYLALGEPVLACEHTQLAADRARHAGQEWIGHEEAYHAHARALQALGHGETARHYAQSARRSIQTKATYITDITLRQQFLSRFGKEG